jgi:hypothetical protein
MCMQAGLTRFGMKTEEFIPILTKEIKNMLILTLFSPFLQLNSVRFWKRDDPNHCEQPHAKQLLLAS